MVLVDTSVWIEHLNRRNRPTLVKLLEDAAVLIHPFIIGELACGSIKNRASILEDLNALPAVKSATHEEVFKLVEDRRLWGRGIGWIDGHLLVSALLSDCPLWTLDQKLNQAAHHAGVATHPAIRNGLNS